MFCLSERLINVIRTRRFAAIVGNGSSPQCPIVAILNCKTVANLNCMELTLNECSILNWIQTTGWGAASRPLFSRLRLEEFQRGGPIGNQQGPDKLALFGKSQPRGLSARPWL
jgi:hypothetical protein